MDDLAARQPELMRQLDERLASTLGDGCFDTHWDADLTDMDLHVLEPSFEAAYYGHNLTTIGSKVSRDFTQGYGPEVYSVRKAMRGIYKVKMQFFGSSAAQLQGAVTLQFDVYTNWGRNNEKRQSRRCASPRTRRSSLWGR